MINIKHIKLSAPVNRSSGLKSVIFLCLLLPVSCRSVIISDDSNLNEQIKAENRIMKQNLTLVIRENRVLKDENIQYKDETGRLKTRVKLLDSEMGSLKKKYDQDIALLNEKYDNLNKKNMILEQESSSKIQELVAVNKTMEEKMGGEIKTLNENIRKQEEKFNRERAAIETAFSSKELEYQKQLSQLKQEILTANIEMESLKSKLAESKANLESANDWLAKKEEMNQNLKKQVEVLTAEIEKKKDAAPEIKAGNP